MIDVLIPVLRRPHAAERVAKAIEQAAWEEHRILFICSKGDSDQIDACLDTGHDVMVMSVEAGAGDYSKKMNAGFRDTEGEWVLLGADDIAPERGWDTIALSAAGDQKHVVATNDKANGMVMRGRFGTHCLVRRSYVEDQGGSCDGPGVLMHEGYDHNFCDRELCHLAQQRKVYVAERRSVIKHLHPNWRTADTDSTYEKGRENFAQDYMHFIERSALWGHVGLTAQEVLHAKNGVPARRRGRR